MGDNIVHLLGSKHTDLFGLTGALKNVKKL